MSQGLRDLIQGIVAGVFLVGLFAGVAHFTDAGELSGDRGIEHECGE